MSCIKGHWQSVKQLLMSGDHVEHTHKVNIKSICEFECVAGVTLVFNPLNIAAMGYFLTGYRSIFNFKK